MSNYNDTSKLPICAKHRHEVINHTLREEVIPLTVGMKLEQTVETLRKLVTSGWEYAIDLAGEWNWKRDTIAKNIREMSELDTFIKECEIALTPPK